MTNYEILLACLQNPEVREEVFLPGLVTGISTPGIHNPSADITELCTSLLLHADFWKDNLPNSPYTALSELMRAGTIPVDHLPPHYTWGILETLCKVELASIPFHQRLDIAIIAQVGGDVLANKDCISMAHATINTALLRNDAAVYRRPLWLLLMKAHNNNLTEAYAVKTDHFEVTLRGSIEREQGVYFRKL